jgi:hypothetical protein
LKRCEAPHSSGASVLFLNTPNGKLLVGDHFLEDSFVNSASSVDAVPEVQGGFTVTTESDPYAVPYKATDDDLPSIFNSIPEAELIP